MAEEIIIADSLSKEEKYRALLPQINALVADERDLIANLSNVAAALKQALGFFWVGFYLVKGDELVLGPFQGPVACTRIGKGKGVCGTAWQEARTVVVYDVREFPGHIACNAASRSEIVVPFFSNGMVTLVMDVDSDEVGAFDEVDVQYLEDLSQILSIEK